MAAHEDSPTVKTITTKALSSSQTSKAMPVTTTKTPMAGASQPTGKPNGGHQQQHVYPVSTTASTSWSPTTVTAANNVTNSCSPSYAQKLKQMNHTMTNSDGLNNEHNTPVTTNQTNANQLMNNSTASGDCHNSKDVNNHLLNNSTIESNNGINNSNNHNIETNHSISDDMLKSNANNDSNNLNVNNIKNNSCNNVLANNSNTNCNTNTNDNTISAGVGGNRSSSTASNGSVTGVTTNVWHKSNVARIIANSTGSNSASNSTNSQHSVNSATHEINGTSSNTTNLWSANTVVNTNNTIIINNSSNNNKSTVNAVSSQHSPNVQKHSSKTKVAPINDINDWPTLGEVHKPETSKRNSEEILNNSDSSAPTSSSEPTVPSNLNKIANNQMNDTTPPSQQSMSNPSNHSTPKPDSSQTHSSQDEEDSANDSLNDRDGGHSSGPGTDSTTNTPKSTKKKGHKRWVPLEIGPPPQAKPPHRNKLATDRRDHRERHDEPRERVTRDQTSGERRHRDKRDNHDSRYDYHSSGNENNHYSDDHTKGSHHRGHDSDGGGTYYDSRHSGTSNRRYRGRGRGSRTPTHPHLPRSRSVADHHDDYPADIIYYPYSLDLTSLMAPLYQPFYPINTFSMTMDTEALKDCIRKQIEYYFSDENLQRDFFLRRKMDASGSLPISLIASFHRVQALTQDVQMVIDSLLDSKTVEILDGIKVRSRVEPLKWPLSDNLNSSGAGLQPNVPAFIPGQSYGYGYGDDSPHSPYGEEGANDADNEADNDDNSKSLTSLINEDLTNGVRLEATVVSKQKVDDMSSSAALLNDKTQSIADSPQ
ncbi:GATA zinc finger domain-containing protein 14-like [Oppia nitens]|uniref:GATA zinc finger domain-containing protein 14-like n=1 Tax=Oppia nitens TaxID=1686743 RepID=UPI0023DB2909|nr:GATA zinc finger domain-containing protein 14-like [Oppia nitens]